MLKHYLTEHPYVLLVMAPLIWGGNAVVGRLAVGQIAPFTLVSLRWGVTLLILLPFVLPSLRRDWLQIRQHIWLLLGFGAVGFALFNMLLYTAPHYTTVINISLIQAVIPMIILLLSILIFREKVTYLQIVGMLLAFLGVLLIVTGGQLQKLSDFVMNRGDLMMLVAALCYALYSLGLRYKPAISWLSFITVCAIGAFITSLPFVGYELLVLPEVITWSLQSCLLILYTSLLASLVAQLAFAKGVSIIGANRAGLAINLIPVFGSLLAVMILGESFHLYHLLALLLVLSGIGLSEYSAKSP